MRKAGNRRGVARHLQRGKLAPDLPAIHHICIIKSCTTQYQCAGRLALCDRSRLGENILRWGPHRRLDAVELPGDLLGLVDDSQPGPVAAEGLRLSAAQLTVQVSCPWRRCRRSSQLPAIMPGAAVRPAAAPRVARILLTVK